MYMYMYIVSFVVILSNWVCDNWVYRKMFPRDSGESIFAARHQDVSQGPLGGENQRQKWGVSNLQIQPHTAESPIHCHVIRGGHPTMGSRSNLFHSKCPFAVLFLSQFRRESTVSEKNKRGGGGKLRGGENIP